jgi:nitrite reductase/ring-hydroxylating ferredoxin subunit
VEFVDVGSDDLDEGCLRGVDVGDERVVIVRSEGRLCAVGGVCTHQVAFLEDGCLSGGRLLCPRHGAAFDLATGAALTAPAEFPVPVFDVRVEGGRILVSRAPRAVQPMLAVDVSADDEPPEE